MHQNSIVITPVANGFVVYLPEAQRADEFQKIGNMIVGLGRKLKDEDLMGKPADDEDKQEPSTEREFNRDKNCHVFKTFGEALAFLTVTFD